MAQTRSTFDLDALLRRIASRQSGLVTVAQALNAGVDRHALARRRRAGALVPVFPGVTRLATVAPFPAQRILAASLIVPNSVVAGPSAAIVHGMPVPQALRAAPAHVVLAVDPSRSVRITGIHAVRLVHAGRSTPWMTTRLSTPAATIVLLARYVGVATLERCLDHCLAERTLSVASVLDVLALSPRRAIGNSNALLRLLAERSDGSVGHRSGLEQRVRRWLDHAGLGGWARNHHVPVGNGDDVEVDFGWIGLRVALEVSPFSTHGSRAKQERDAERRRLLALAGWTVVEALDDHVVDEAAFACIASTLRLLLRPAAA